MDRFIKSLKSYAKEDFPVKQVSDFILKSNFQKKLANIHILMKIILQEI